MKNPETSSETPATLTSVKPATLKWVGKFVAQSHQSPSLGHSATWLRGNSQLPASPWGWKEKIGPYFQCCDFFWGRREAAGGTGFCLACLRTQMKPDILYMPVDHWEQKSWVACSCSRGCSTTDGGQYSLAVSPSRGEEKSRECVHCSGFSGGCPRKWPFSCLSWSLDETWHILDAWKLLRTTTKIDGRHDDRQQREWETTKSWKDNWQITSN